MEQALIQIWAIYGLRKHNVENKLGEDLAKGIRNFQYSFLKWFYSTNLYYTQ